MKTKIMFIIVLLSLLLLSACDGGTAHLNNRETKAICNPYCSEKGMNLNMDRSITYKNTVVCNCDSEPILRMKYQNEDHINYTEEVL